jgi:hypothetical protein
MSSIGTNAGALTAKVVAPPSAPCFADAEYSGACGSLGRITEVAAIQRALCEAGGESDAVAPLGGETFLVHAPERGLIVNVLSHDKRAARRSESQGVTRDAV